MQQAEVNANNVGGVRLKHDGAVVAREDDLIFGVRSSEADNENEDERNDKTVSYDHGKLPPEPAIIALSSEIVQCVSAVRGRGLGFLADVPGTYVPGYLYSAAPRLDHAVLQARPNVGLIYEAIAAGFFAGLTASRAAARSSSATCTMRIMSSRGAGFPVQISN